jgi:uncharacterized surface protein with fasciclin (FAS1) repeats
MSVLFWDYISNHKIIFIMRTRITILFLTMMMFAFASCSNEQQETTTTDNNNTDQKELKGQSAVEGIGSDGSILAIAIGSKDHTTLVAAVQAAGLVDALANNGPFSVFAPTNEAFDALPEGVVADLLKPENKQTLYQILLGHVTTTGFPPEALKEGMSIAMVDSKFTRWTITHKDGDIYIGDAKILGSVPATNGYVHVIDKVLLAPAE